jgi:ElaB/YqjD/DUF883 family membrane-anchored ribosome-binding protein
MGGRVADDNMGGETRKEETVRYRADIYARLERMDSRMDRMDSRSDATDDRIARIDIRIAETCMTLANLVEWQKRQNGSLQSIETLIKDQAKRLDDLYSKTVWVLVGIVSSLGLMVASFVFSRLVK